MKLKKKNEEEEEERSLREIIITNFNNDFDHIQKVIIIMTGFNIFTRFIIFVLSFSMLVVAFSVVVAFNSI